MHEEQPTKAARPNEAMYVIGWCCAVVAAAVATATAAARFATAVLLPLLRRQRAKGIRVRVIAGGGAALHLFLPS